MSKIIYFEDIFLQFYIHDENHTIGIQYQDRSPLESFYMKLSTGQAITQNQANYIIKILEKYKNLSKLTGFDYEGDLTNASWKNNFRVLDLTKKIYVEKREDGQLEICLKFPYQLKTEFDKEIDINLPGSNRVSHWDHENKVRRLRLYDFNLINLYEFAVKHSFVIDETFMCALADIEEIWQNQEEILPFSTIAGSQVLLGNSSTETDEWFKSHALGIIENDLLLAKSMGFVYKGKPKTAIQKIVASSENSFWVKNNSDLFNIFKNINGKVCVVLDRTSNTLSWLKQFVHSADENGISRDDIRVCFRENKDANTGLNEWIKLAGVGGKIDEGRIFIFEHKPAKWLFKDPKDIKIVVTNNLYPHTSQATKDWLDSHPCVIYLGDIKPSEQRGKKIVEL